MLIDVEMSALENYLNPNKLKIESKGVDSVKARVMNLKESNNQINCELFRKSLTKSFLDYH